MAAATALDRAEAAAMQHDLATLASGIMKRRRARRKRSSIGSRRSSLGTPHASQLNWTSEEDGTDADGEEDLPDVVEAEEPGDTGTDAEIEPRSPPEAPTLSDEEFIVDDYDPAEGDETYVKSATDDEEDEEHELTLMLSTLTLTNRQRRVLSSRISTIRKHRVNRKLWAKYPAIKDTPAPIARPAHAKQPNPSATIPPVVPNPQSRPEGSPSVARDEAAEEGSRERHTRKRRGDAMLLAQMSSPCPPS